MKMTVMKAVIWSAGSALLVGGSSGYGEEFKLGPINVVSDTRHETGALQQEVESSLNSARSVSEVSGGVIQNLNPVNKLDGLRYHATGLINQPWNGDRFGGGTKIRTFGDWGASESIDGLPTFESSGQEGGGFSHTLIPSIAIENIQVRKGGHAVQYGSGTDGGVLQTNIKSGRSYKDHAAVSFDASNIEEAQLQAEAADSTERWDYYVAGKYFQGDYSGDPDNLDGQDVRGAVGKFGWNVSDKTRAELTLIYDRSHPDIIRGGEIQPIQTHSQVGAVTIDHRLSENGSLELGLVANHSHSIWDARGRDRSIDNQISFINYFHSRSLKETIQYNGTLGVEYKHTNAKRDGAWDNTFDDSALILRNALTFDDNLVLSAGLRHTWFSNDIVVDGETQPDTLETDGILSYELSAAYSVLENTRLRASATSGYNRFFSKYGNFGTDALNTNGAGDEVVESDTLELGINQAFGFGSLDVAVYNTVQDNVPRRNSGAIESMEVEQSGLEAEVFAGVTERLTLSAGYMHIFDLEATRADGTKVNGNIFWDGQTAQVPEDQFNLRANYYVTDAVQVWGAGYYSAGYEAVDAIGDVVEREAFARMDLGVNWQVNPGWHLRLRAENLLDEHNFGQTIEGAPSTDDGKLGRVFWVGTDYQF